MKRLTDLERVELALRRAMHGKDVPIWVHEFAAELRQLNEHHGEFEVGDLARMRKGEYS